MAKKKKHAVVKAKSQKESAQEGPEWLDSKVKSILAIAAILILSLIIAYSSEIFEKDSSIVAKVGKEKVTMQQLDTKYAQLVSDEYKTIISKESFLNQTIIPEILLIQAADKKKIKVTAEETESFISAYIEQIGMTREELDKQLAEQGMDYAAFTDFYSSRLKIIKYLNSTLGTPDVSDAEIDAFYEENKASFVFGNESVDMNDVKDQIKSYLANQKQQEQIKVHIEGLMEKADIKVYPENIRQTTASIGSFADTNNAACYDNGKPIIRLYSTTTCPHCRWIKQTFDTLMKEYVAKGTIVAYHWEVDTGDDTLTDAVETTIPSSEIQLLQKYNSGGGVPFFIFGCKYIRIGNAYEMQDDLASEEQEFRNVIELLLTNEKNETSTETS